MTLILRDSRTASPADLLPVTPAQRTELAVEVQRNRDIVVVQIAAGWKPFLQQSLLGVGFSSLVHVLFVLGAIRAPQWWAVPSVAASFLLLTASGVIAAFIKSPRQDHPVRLWQHAVDVERSGRTSVAHVVHLRAWRGGPAFFVAEHQVQVHHVDPAGSRAELVVSSQRTRGGLARRLAAELGVPVRYLDLPESSAPSEAEWKKINSEHSDSV